MFRQSLASSVMNIFIPAGLRRLDEYTLNAWPAWQTVLLDGWLLRYAGGYTKRANSVNALYPGTMPLEEKIAQAEAFYRARELPVVFRLAPFSQPPDLETVLAERGYRRIDPTQAQLLDLSGWPAAAADHVQQLPLPAWMPLYRAFAGQDEGTANRHAALLSNIIGKHGLFVLAIDGQPVSCGVGVLSDDALGLFDITTDPERLRQGFARRLVEGMLAWGCRHGARRAYLQVMDSNVAALKLYAGLGFELVYPYWYRVSP
jgi:ribosomal protein S18 acetylase RimI-like enzyme